jgi:hypothetical protein
LLADAGVRVESPTADDGDRTWAVVQRFAGESVADAAPAELNGDGLLAQCGVYDSGNGVSSWWRPSRGVNDAATKVLRW